MLISDLEKKIAEIEKQLKTVKPNTQQENRLLGDWQFYQEMKARLELEQLLDS